MGSQPETRHCISNLNFQSKSVERENYLQSTDLGWIGHTENFDQSASTYSPHGVDFTILTIE